MTKYLNKYDKENKLFKVKIFLAKHKWGRVVYEDQTSISIFHRPTRHTYCKDKYIDIDIVNSAPSIIYEILKMNGIIKNNFKYYIDNRDDIIKEIMELYNISKDVSKKLFLILMHGGSYNCWKYENKINDNNKELPKIVKDIISDLESIIDIIYTHNKNVISLKDKWKNSEEQKKGIFSLWYQTIERNIQETMINIEELKCA
jgi:hypothetical protein